MRVTDAELLSMRDAGMTNADIANSLGVTPQTIIRHIGPQPGKNWGDYKRRMGMPNTACTGISEAIPDAPAQALTVANLVTYLTGEVAQYSVDTKARMVKFMVPGAESMLEIPFDAWRTFVREVQAVVGYLKDE